MPEGWVTVDAFQVFVTRLLQSHHNRGLGWREIKVYPPLSDIITCPPAALLITYWQKGINRHNIDLPLFHPQ